jgi:hypothetical protein
MNTIQSNPSCSFRRLETSSFNTMFIMLDYYNNNYYDLSDIVFGVFL